MKTYHVYVTLLEDGKRVGERRILLAHAPDRKTAQSLFRRVFRAALPASVPAKILADGIRRWKLKWRKSA